MDELPRNNPHRMPPPLWLGAMGGVSLVGALYGARKAGFCVDDGLITATFARNLAVGNGMVFNPGEYVPGVTTPLWCLLQAAVMVVAPWAREDVAGIWALAVVAHFLAAMAVGLLAWRLGAKGWSLLAAAGWLLVPYHAGLFGMEYGLATALGIGALLLHDRKRAFLCGIACSLLALTRPDAALLPMLLFGLLVIQKEWRRALWLAIPVGVVGILTLLAFQLYYGSPLPNTFGAKRLQFANREEFVWIISVGQGAWRYLLVGVLRGDVIPALLTLFGLGVLVTSGWREGGGRIASLVAIPGVQFLAWVVLHLGVLTLLGVAHYDWYLWPLWIVLPVAVSVGMARLGELIPATGARPAFLAAVTVLLLVSWQGPWAGDPAGAQRDRRDGYFRLADVVNERAGGESASLLTYEIGALGFRLHPHIHVYDEFLLITPNPTPGRFPSRSDMVMAFEPDYLVETHPHSETLTTEQLTFQAERHRPDFYLEFHSATDGTPLRYDIIAKDESRFGLLVLYGRR